MGEKGNKRMVRSKAKLTQRRRPITQEEAPPKKTWFGQSTSSSNSVRETVESIVIAFVLAFLFRTFEAEAFVIPTGSMAPTLQGRHKDVRCPQCGFRTRASASVEAEENVDRLRGGLERIKSHLEQLDRQLAQMPAGHNRDFLLQRRQELRHNSDHIKRQISGHHVVSATCPMCRYSMAADEETSYNGDRILVSKFAYPWKEPDRYDVAVFKYPGSAKMNYIKRVVGLPQETVRIRHGNIYVKRKGEKGFTIARKPVDKVRSMMHLVHDNRYEPQSLADRNWPFRWRAWPPGAAQKPGGWVHQTLVEDGVNVGQVFSTDGTAKQTEWIRYQHLVPEWRDWQRIGEGPLEEPDLAKIKPQLITDFYAYNTNMVGERGPPDPSRLGLHWVGDLMVECGLEVVGSGGEVVLDLVKGGKHFNCRINVETGKVTLAIEGDAAFAPQANTRVHGPGTYELAFANVDDQLLLWVDGSRVEFDKLTGYEERTVYGVDQPRRPTSTVENAGDLAPAGIGSHGAAVRVTGLRVWRDIYYIADRHVAIQQPISDLPSNEMPLLQLSNRSRADFLSDPAQWSVFERRKSHDFELDKDQFFVLGDNSPFSKDGRLWNPDEFPQYDQSAHYVKRDLLIGKALFIYWPHSWNRLPGTRIPLPFFPNIMDMGLVR